MLLFVGVSISACRAELPRPPLGVIPPGSGIEIPYPPPPGRVETVPHKEKDDQVWIDGQWDWDGKAWAWNAGSWTVPPANAYFTPWMTRRLGDGRLFFERAAWRAKDGRRIGNAGAPDLCALPDATKAP